jgi:hypothetical protein
VDILIYYLPEYPFGSEFKLSRNDYPVF